MFTFEETDLGFSVHQADGQIVARIKTHEAAEPVTVKDAAGNPARGQDGQPVYGPGEVKHFPKDQRRHHFTGHQLTTAELEAYVAEAAALP